MTKDIVIIGGGPAGLAAAVAARDAGAKEILVIERDEILGGILNQCIHNGFGLHTFKEELTGPEYASRFIKQVEERRDGIDTLLKTIVIDVRAEGDTKTVTCMSKEQGIFTVDCKSVILAMGCRERPRGALNIPGLRPAGVYSAGTAQRIVNIEGRLPGKNVVILGSGDIGLIMARRMTLEGAKVHAVLELMPYSGGLKRNIVQCLNDFDIPLRLSTTVIDIGGRERLEYVVTAEVDKNLKPIPGTEEKIECDTLLLSCGLLPENELTEAMGVKINPKTGGAEVDESFETSISGVFSCGNVLHVHDLVDFVSEEAKEAGKRAAAYVLNTVPARSTDEIRLVPGAGVRYTIPVSIRKERLEDLLTIRFRVTDVYKDPEICVYFDDKCIRRQKKKIVAPGEMEQVILRRQDICAEENIKEIKIQLE